MPYDSILCKVCASWVCMLTLTLWTHCVNRKQTLLYDQPSYFVAKQVRYLIGTLHKHFFNLTFQVFIANQHLHSYLYYCWLLYETAMSGHACLINTRLKYLKVIDTTKNLCQIPPGIKQLQIFGTNELFSQNFSILFSYKLTKCYLSKLN